MSDLSMNNTEGLTIIIEHCNAPDENKQQFPSIITHHSLVAREIAKHQNEIIRLQNEIKKLRYGFNDISVIPIDMRDVYSSVVDTSDGLKRKKPSMREDATQLVNLKRWKKTGE